jgi:excisionase family DNA binding protein
MMNTFEAPNGVPSNRKARRAEAARLRGKPEQPAPLPNAFAYRVNDACRMVGIGRTKLYALAKKGKLKLLRIGGRTLVCGDSLRSLPQLGAQKNPPARAPTGAAYFERTRFRS